ncbi:MAG: BrnT family toxin [Ruminococcaceae bacterium]|nr:BrnT family toxin [Oscillospiraceae bacterium]
MKFEWDENKNKINKKKHDVSFEEVIAVFYDDFAILFDDPEHSEKEERFLIIGMSSKKGICIVSHCYRSEDKIIRIISARKATKREQTVYYEEISRGEYNERRI